MIKSEDVDALESFSIFLRSYNVMMKICSIWKR